MGLPAGQRRILRRAEHALRRCDPRLTALFCLFSRLNSDEEMPRTEQVRGRVAVALTPVTRPAAAFARWFGSPRRARLRRVLFFPVALGLVASAVLAGSSFPSSNRCPQALRVSRTAHTSAGPKRIKITCPPRVTPPVLFGH